MHDDNARHSERNDVPEPVRPPTGREKFSVLLPALVALLGLIAMLAIFVILASMSRS